MKLASKAEYLKSFNVRRGDFTTPEQNIPDDGVAGVDRETCMTMNTTWGHNQHDQKCKSPAKLLLNRVDVVSKGGNYLLNIGPKAAGSAPPESIERMRVLGVWMNVNAEAIGARRLSIKSDFIRRPVSPSRQIRAVKQTFVSPCRRRDNHPSQDPRLHHVSLLEFKNSRYTRRL